MPKGIYFIFNSYHQPVIACVHGNCIGGGVDLISWCDIRLATQDATFSIKETQIAIVAGTNTIFCVVIAY